MSTFQERMAPRVVRPCSSCGSTAFYAGRIGMEVTSGGGGHNFDVVICRACGKTEFFVDEDPSAWVARRQGYYEFYEYQTTEPKKQ